MLKYALLMYLVCSLFELNSGETNITSRNKIDAFESLEVNNPTHKYENISVDKQTQTYVNEISEVDDIKMATILPPSQVNFKDIDPINASSQSDKEVKQFTDVSINSKEVFIEGLEYTTESPETHKASLNDDVETKDTETHSEKFLDVERHESTLFRSLEESTEINDELVNHKHLATVYETELSKNSEKEDISDDIINSFVSSTIDNDSSNFVQTTSSTDKTPETIIEAHEELTSKPLVSKENTQSEFVFEIFRCCCKSEKKCIEFKELIRLMCTYFKYGKGVEFYFDYIKLFTITDNEDIRGHMTSATGNIIFYDEMVGYPNGSIILTAKHLDASEICPGRCFFLVLMSYFT
ncbi:hypothetical protein CDIK_3676 [Cucumispora dikerogammari]|nr:hypothetical protein CDIK_3676 [Cucumispora dikerogammari]